MTTRRTSFLPVDAMAQADPQAITTTNSNNNPQGIQNEPVPVSNMPVLAGGPAPAPLQQQQQGQQGQQGQQMNANQLDRRRHLFRQATSELREAAGRFEEEAGRFEEEGDQLEEALDRLTELAARVREEADLAREEMAAGQLGGATGLSEEIQNELASLELLFMEVFGPSISHTAPLLSINLATGAPHFDQDLSGLIDGFSSLMGQGAPRN